MNKKISNRNTGKNARTKKKSRNLSSNKDIRAAKLGKLQKSHDELELQVQKRTIELAKANEVLQAEIAERKQAEEINKFQANILSQVSDAVIVLDNDHRIIYWNNGAERLYNLRNDEVLGRQLEESYRYLRPHPDDEKAARDSLAEKGFWRKENIPVKRGGEEIYVDATMSALRDESGTKIGLLAVVRDVTERRKIEEALRESEEKYRNLFDSAGDAIITINLDDNVTSWNRSAERIFGWKAVEAIGKKLNELIVPQDMAAGRKKIISDSLAGKNITGIETVRQRKDGSRIDVSLTSSPIINAKQEIIGLSGILRDITERKRAEKALRESEERFRALAENVPDMITRFDRNLRLLYANPAVFRRTGLTREALVGSTALEYGASPMAAARWERTAREVLDFGEPRWLEHTNHWQGETRVFDVQMVPERDVDGAVRAVIAIARDITERKQIEKERLRLSEEINKRHKQTENLAMNLKKERDTLHIIMENTDTELAYLDSKFNFIRVNSAYAAGSGYSKEGLIGRNHFELFPDPENHAIFEKVRDTGEAVEFRARPFEFKDQPWRGVTYWDWTLSPLKDASGGVDRLVLSLTDVTDRIRNEQTMQKALTYAEGIVDTIPEPLLILDSGLCVKTVNHAFYKMFKVRVEDTTNKMLYELGNRQWDIPGLRKLLDDVIPRNKYVQNFEVEHDFPTIGRKTMLLNARRVYLEGKEMILLAIADITERKKIDEIRLENERLISTGKARSELLSVMSHELRTPLTSIIGYSILLNEKMHGKLTGKQEFYIESILNNGKHLLSLINTILDLAKLEAGKLEMVFEDISVPDTINESLALMKEKALVRNIHLKKEFDPELTNIKADGQKFKQILFNLLSNALKFSKEEEGVITVSTKKEGDMAKISVSDTGIGIKGKDIPRLFRKFEQLDSGISRKYGGTGLGLAITKQLVEMHGGNISAESRYGEGSTFTFLLPIEGREK